MALDIIFLVDGSDSSLVRFNKHKERFPHAKKFVTLLTGTKAYKAASKLSNTSNFFLVDHECIVDKGFDFSFIPEEYDRTYIHIWRYLLEETTLVDAGIFIFQKGILRTDEDDLTKIGSGIKYFETVAPELPIENISIIFLSYDEPNANANWQSLRKRFPYAKRVNKVNGILNAHKTAAAISRSPGFFVVDGDSEILETFTFDLNFSEYDIEHYVHIWKCRNPVNGLEYGYGGVKLFHKKMFENFDSGIVDMSTLLGDGVKLMDEVASITSFNSSDFHAFRSAFRECTKLSSGIIKNHDIDESKERLAVWIGNATGDYAEDVLLGAKLGKQYGTDNATNVKALEKINDFKWLYHYFRKQKMEQKEKDLLYTKYNKIDTKTITNLTNLLYSEDKILPLEELRDCLSMNELLSKFWLIDELNKLQLGKELEILIIDGAFGTLANFLFQFYSRPQAIIKILSTDSVPKFEKIADALNIDNVVDGWRFKAVTEDPYNINYEKTEGQIRDGNTTKYVYMDWDVLIAPHCERLQNVDTWSALIPKGKLVIAQTNNFGFDNLAADNEFDKFKAELNLTQVLYQGVMPCHVYDRYMVIGIR
jgi:hypothetical protein